MARRVVALVVLLSVAALGCRRADPQGEGASHAAREAWAVTAWGERYEVFAETDALVAGESATSNAHVTVLAGFAPLEKGAVTLVLAAGRGRRAFRQETPKRSGIFAVEAKPRAEGTFDLVFRIESAAGPEEIAAGRVRVGSAAAPGGLVAEESPAATDAVSFLKEQQWRTEFATAWVEEGALGDSVEGPARVTVAGGGEVVLTAGVDATVAPSPWPHPGLDVAAGGTVFRIVPRVGDRSLPELRAEASSLEAEVDVARRRVERLTELLRVEATSQAELERARAALSGLEARLVSARGGVAATVAPGGADASVAFALRAPWAGRVAEVSVSPGQTVAAGTALGRLVRVRPLWIVAALGPEEASRVQASPRGLFLRRPGQPVPVEIGAGSVRLVSRSPQVDPRRRPSTSSSRSTTALSTCRSAAPSRRRSCSLARARRRRAALGRPRRLRDERRVRPARRRELRAPRGPCPATPRERSPRRGAPTRRAAGDAGSGRRPAQLAPLRGRARRPRPLKGGGNARPNHPRLAPPPVGRPRGGPRAPRGRGWPDCAAARRRLPGPHRADGHRHHRGEGAGARGGRAPRDLPGRVGPQRRVRRPPRALGVGAGDRGRLGRVRVGRGRLPGAPGRGRAPPDRRSPGRGRSTDPRADQLDHGRDHVHRPHVRPGGRHGAAPAGGDRGAPEPPRRCPASPRSCRSAASVREYLVELDPAAHRAGRGHRGRGGRARSSAATRRPGGGIPRRRRAGVPRARPRPGALEPRTSASTVLRVRGRDPAHGSARSPRVERGAGARARHRVLPRRARP